MGRTGEPNSGEPNNKLKEETLAERGDYTGRLLEKARAEHAAELAGRQRRIGMTRGDYVVEEDGIFDPKTGQRLSPEEEAELEAQSKKYRHY
jgi:hypothetical protein